MQTGTINTRSIFSVIAGAFVLVVYVVTGSVASAQEQTYHLKLKNHLDRDDVGYCLELLGRPDQARLDTPLIAHSCKTVLAVDDAIVMTEEGRIRFPAFDACVTVMGLAGATFEFNSLMLKGCGLVEPYLDTQPFQAFTMNDRDQVQLDGTDLCLTAGDTSSVTTRPDHNWRGLYMQNCGSAPLNRSQWYLHNPEE